MSNAVYTFVIRALAGVVSDRAADHMLRAALDDAGLSPETVSAQAMQEVLVGPLLTRLSAVMPAARAKSELRDLAYRLQMQEPKAPTLFNEPAGGGSGLPSWDMDALTAPQAGTALADPGLESLGSDDFEWDEDDFEFDDPEEEGLRTAIPVRSYALGGSEGQEALLGDLARQRGVQGVVICDRQGKVLRSRLSRGAQQLGDVVAATALVLGGRSWRVLSAELGSQTVCIRPLGDYFVAILASGNTNLGRLIAELGALQEATA